MINSTAMIAAAEAAIAISDALVAASQTLIDNARAQMAANPPTVTLDEYRELMLRHAAIVGNASTIRAKVAIDLGPQVHASIDALQAVATRLNDAMADLARVQNVIDKTAKVLVAAGAVATLAASPSVLAVGAIVSAVSAVIQP